jgi:uncharacterized protein (TIGR02594 family)
MSRIETSHQPQAEAPPQAGLRARSDKAQPPRDKSSRADARAARNLVAGTRGNDTIHVTKGPKGSVNITVNGKTTTLRVDAKHPLVIAAGAGNDIVKVDPSVKQNVVIKGGSGNDQLTGGSRNDRIYGGKGRDVIAGGGGADQLSGGAGNDRIMGGRGNDHIEGGGGNDQLLGGRGDDHIEGGAGKDAIRGGPGKDDMIQDNSWIEIAKRELGVKEWNPGSNPRIEQYHNTTNARGSSDDTPWCSSFVNWVMERAGYQGTDSAGALSWKSWGERVPLSEARPGDIVFFQRGSRSSDDDHVGFVVSHDPKNKTITVLGGNQSDAVTNTLVESYGDDIEPPTIVRPRGVSVG